MPNHVYTTLTLANAKYAPKIKEAIKLIGGLAEYVKPMPDEIRNTVSPVCIVNEEEKNNDPDNPQRITQAESDRLIATYGDNNWYDWACRNWGTKWGTYDHDWDEGTLTLHFQTAWSMLDPDILKLIAKRFGDFTMHAEEESGDFDVVVDAINGKLV